MDNVPKVWDLTTSEPMDFAEVNTSSILYLLG